MTAAALAFPLVVAFWAFVAWRVRVEQGRVHRPPTTLERLRAAIAAMEGQMGVALGEVCREAARQMSAWAKAYTDHLALADVLDLPPGYSVSLDTRPLLDPKGDTRT